METTGCGTAIVTPFRADGSVDEPALWALVNWQIDSGIDFLVACGSTGEAATLDEEEWLNDRAHRGRGGGGRVPVWAGCTHNSTRTLVRQAALLRGARASAPCSRPIPTTTSPRRRASSSIFWRWPRRSIRCRCASTTCPAAPAVNLEPETVVAAGRGRAKHSGHQGSQRQAAADCRAGAHPAPRLQDLFRRRQPGPGRHRRGRARAHQRGLQRGSGRGGTDGPRRAQQQLGRGARARAPLCAALRSQFLGVESGPGEDRAEPDGPVHRPSCACLWFRPLRPPARAWSGWPAKWACSSTRLFRRGCVLKSFERIAGPHFISHKSVMSAGKDSCVYVRNFSESFRVYGVRRQVTTRKRAHLPSHANSGDGSVRERALERLYPFLCRGRVEPIRVRAFVRS